MEYARNKDMLKEYTRNMQGTLRKYTGNLQGIKKQNARILNEYARNTEGIQEHSKK